MAKAKHHKSGAERPDRLGARGGGPAIFTAEFDRTIDW